MESARILTASLIDYAGLFPPAQLGMGDAVKNYAEYVDSSNAHMLGRFVLPAGRLDEFGEIATKYLQRDSRGTAWRLAVLLSEEFVKEIPSVLKFNCSHWEGSPAGHVVVDVVEMKASTAAEVAALRSALPEFYSAFIEVPPSAPQELLAAIKAARFSVKIRTGGIVQSAFPADEQIVQFMAACKSHHLAFKATAGLHHLVCSSYPLTYEPDAPSAPMFGFLNIFAAAAFMFAGTNEGDVREIVNERDAAAFSFSNDGLSWRDRLVVNADIEAARKEFANSFGSCSFTEPVEELHRLLSPPPKSQA